MRGGEGGAGGGDGRDVGHFFWHMNNGFMSSALK